MTPATTINLDGVINQKLGLFENVFGVLLFPCKNTFLNILEAIVDLFVLK